MVHVWQRLFFDNRIMATDNVNPDYVALAESYGIESYAPLPCYLPWPAFPSPHRPWPAFPSPHLPWCHVASGTVAPPWMSCRTLSTSSSTPRVPSSWISASCPTSACRWSPQVRPTLDSNSTHTHTHTHTHMSSPPHADVASCLCATWQVRGLTRCSSPGPSPSTMTPRTTQRWRASPRRKCCQGVWRYEAPLGRAAG